MPHSSRKKKALPARRIEVTDEQGWTTITNTKAKHKVPERVERTQQDDDTTYYIYPGFVVPDIEKNATLGTVTSKYNAVREKWLTSELCVSLSSIIQHKIAEHDLHIKKIILLGSGTFCGVWPARQSNGLNLPPVVGRHECSMLQLAAFRTMRETLENQQKCQIKAIAQEPFYNKLDLDLLRSFDIDVVEDPEAFEHVGNTSLVYAPGAELNVEVRSILSRPGIWLGGQLDTFWRNSKGKVCTNRIIPVGPGEPIWARFDSSEQTNLCERLEALAWNEDSPSESVEVLEEFGLAYEHYDQDTEHAKLPEYTHPEHPFNNNYIYWLRVGTKLQDFPEGDADVVSGQTQGVSDGHI